MKILKLLEYLQTLEEGIGDLYRWYVEVFAADAEAATLFSWMTREEKDHYNMVQFERGLVLKNRGLFADVEVDERELKELIEKAETLRAAGLPALEDALKNAISLENSAAETHFRTAIIQSNPELKTLINSLGQGDQFHFDHLMRFVEKRGLIPEGARKSDPRPE